VRNIIKVGVACSVALFLAGCVSPSTSGGSSELDISASATAGGNSSYTPVSPAPSSPETADINFRICISEEKEKRVYVLVVLKGKEPFSKRNQISSEDIAFKPNLLATMPPGAMSERGTALSPGKYRYILFRDPPKTGKPIEVNEIWANSIVQELPLEIPEDTGMPLKAVITYFFGKACRKIM